MAIALAFSEMASQTKTKSFGIIYLATGLTLGVAWVSARHLRPSIKFCSGFYSHTRPTLSVRGASEKIKMVLRVFRPGHNLKVPWRIVKLVAIFMMNNFIGEKFSLDRFLYNVAMFQKSAPSRPDHLVSTSVYMSALKAIISFAGRRNGSTAFRAMNPSASFCSNKLTSTVLARQDFCSFPMFHGFEIYPYTGGVKWPFQAQQSGR